MLQALWTRVRSMGLTFVLGFLLCIFQSSESILVKLAGNRPEPHPASAKLLFLSELLKLLSKSLCQSSTVSLACFVCARVCVHSVSKNNGHTTENSLALRPPLETREEHQISFSLSPP